MKSIDEVREYLVEAIAREESYLDDFLGRREATPMQLTRAYSALCALRMALGAVDGGEL